MAWPTCDECGTELNCLDSKRGTFYCPKCTGGAAALVLDVLEQNKQSQVGKETELENLRKKVKELELRSGVRERPGP